MTHIKNNLMKHIIVVLLLSSFTASAGGFDSLSDREKRWELSFQTRYINSINIDFKGDAEASLNDTLAWAIGLGYNFTENWAFNFDIGWSEAGYSGTRIDDNGAPATVSGNLYSSTVNFSGIYNFTNKRFTPFAGASIGWTFIDTNVPSGEPPETVCWWDPWWGYVCSNYLPTKTTTEFNYGLVLGMRFDVNEKLFFRGSAGKQWIDFNNASGTPDLTVFRFDIGVMF